METLHIGLDIGSTTVKLIVIDEKARVRFHCYERHHSKVREKALEMLKDAFTQVGECNVTVALSGSAGIGVAKETGIRFFQEVFATKFSCQRLLDQIDVVVELGGEDAKIIFLTGGGEERMNGSCAGGTGAFIDQMASLLSLSIDELDALSQQHNQIYNIASRCGVFAKSDIQPLINQGANKADIAASIYQAIVDQTIAGLAQGREIKGRVVFLGGPLAYQKGLRDRFVETLQLDEKTAIFPNLAEYFVAMGAALLGSDGEARSFAGFIGDFEEAVQHRPNAGTLALPPLFADEGEYEVFCKRHQSAGVRSIPPAGYTGDAYLGIDAGSTTTKLALITPEGALLYSYYSVNKGEPLSIIQNELSRIYALCGDRIRICSTAVTGYGEELMKSAFSLDFGIVETTAHYYAARRFSPKVEFILDIGGQDMKCFKLKNGIVESIMLNEACSSGCGSFIENFASAMGYGTADFAKAGLFAKHPVDLGSRCTVFMNSSVKQAQKDGATVADISAGLAASVVKNLLYKVIRAANPDELGQYIVVQGGTFLNDCVLRAFEIETGRTVVRPQIAGLMGAYGAALYAMENRPAQSGLISKAALDAFTHTSSTMECHRCTNHCKLTINKFQNGRHISGNRCDKPVQAGGIVELPNAYAFKMDYLNGLRVGHSALAPTPRGQIGLPMGLNFYELLPFWHAIFTSLGFEVVVSGPSSRKLYASGQYTIPSDTVCYPAKLIHGHMQQLLDQGITTIFYPCMPYNFDEEMGDNHYNCPVVAHYPELLAANMTALGGVRFLYPYLAPHHQEGFAKKAEAFFKREFGIGRREVEAALQAGYAAHDSYMAAVKQFGQEALVRAEEEGRTVVILAGRPYHVDPEISHGIDQLIVGLGAVVLSEDCVSDGTYNEKVYVLNQWTYHSRLYSAAEFAGKYRDGVHRADMELVQLVSFGCGLDAVTSDEVKSILQRYGKIYTQIKIDEINNLGAAKIRLRSLLEALKRKEA